MNDLLTRFPRPAPDYVTLKGRFVTIRPIDPVNDPELIWEALGREGINQRLAYFACPDFHAPSEFAVWLESIRKAGWLTHVFIENATGKVVGMANYMRADPANGVVEVGGVAHGLAMARSPMSTEAHYLMARHVFDDLGYRRYEWKCNNANEASKVTAIRYGFTFEGVFRKAQISRGKNRDTAWYSMIDDEWPQIKAAFETWLSPDNFDNSGQQIRKLEDIRASQRT